MHVLFSDESQALWSLKSLFFLKLSKFINKKIPSSKTPQHSMHHQNWLRAYRLNRMCEMWWRRRRTRIQLELWKTLESEVLEWGYRIERRVHQERDRQNRMQWQISCLKKRRKNMWDFKMVNRAIEHTLTMYVRSLNTTYHSSSCF